MVLYRACLCIKGLGLSFGITPSSPIQKHAIYTPSGFILYALSVRVTETMSKQ